MMKLRALDQVHISSVQPDSLRPGQVFEVTNATGKELMKAHPHLFEEASAEEDEPEAAKDRPAAEPSVAMNDRRTAPRRDEKDEPAPANKAEPAPDRKGR